MRGGKGEADRIHPRSGAGHLPALRAAQRAGAAAEAPRAAGAHKTPQEQEQHRPSRASPFPSRRPRTFLRLWVSQCPAGRR